MSRPPDVESRFTGRSAPAHDRRTAEVGGDGRVGCGFCFATLDPADPHPDRRAFVQCGRCGRAFHDHPDCRRPVCTRPGCRGEQFVGVRVAPPPPWVDTPPVPPPPVELGRVVVVDGGRLTDAPLGVAPGYLYFLFPAVGTVRVRNNRPAWAPLPAHLGPPWVTVRNADPDDPLVPTVLAPNDEVRLEVECDVVRPGHTAVRVRLTPERSLVLGVDAGGPLRWPGVGLLLGLLLVHAMTFLLAVAGGGGFGPTAVPAVVLGLAVGLTAMMSPGLVVAVVGRWVPRQGGSPVDGWRTAAVRSLARRRDGLTAFGVRSLAAGMAGVLVTLLGWVPLALLSAVFGLFGPLPGGWLWLTLLFVGHVGLLGGVFAGWLKDYGCDLWACVRTSGVWAWGRVTWAWDRLTKRG